MPMLCFLHDDTLFTVIVPLYHLPRVDATYAIREESRLLSCGCFPRLYFTLVNLRALKQALGRIPVLGIRPYDIMPSKLSTGMTMFFDAYAVSELLTQMV